MDNFATSLASAQASAPKASAAMLTGTWNLVYTTEKEVLSLIGDPGVSVYQKLDSGAGTLGNSIVFTDGKRFDVKGTVSSGAPPEDATATYPPGLRSDFRFVGASLTVSPGLILPLPPFGAGWFVSVYLDDNLRVNRDSRGDLAIYLRA
ncbi:PAP11 [Symbiodinium pilosum]|uniref:PAP11 protein n=1 Tax=Symbiodinium pilosum TaxID=2952 RepID=A0A812SGQ9_SYMPI|nr:PAP11 [Symbiodinium pilosum]